MSRGLAEEGEEGLGDGEEGVDVGVVLGTEGGEGEEFNRRELSEAGVVDESIQVTVVLC